MLFDTLRAGTMAPEQAEDMYVEGMTRSLITACLSCEITDPTTTKRFSSYSSRGKHSAPPLSQDKEGHNNTSSYKLRRKDSRQIFSSESFVPGESHRCKDAWKQSSKERWEYERGGNMRDGNVRGGNMREMGI